MGLIPRTPKPDISHTGQEAVEEQAQQAQALDVSPRRSPSSPRSSGLHPGFPLSAMVMNFFQPRGYSGDVFDALPETPMLLSRGELELGNAPLTVESPQVFSPPRSVIGSKRSDP